MKQILLTAKKKSASSQLEVADFLKACNHSPEWIGKAENWEIKSFLVYQNEKGQQCVTALLENKVWEKPSVTPLTAKQIYDCVKDINQNTKVSVGFREGLNGRLCSYDFGQLDYFLNGNGDYMLTFERQNNNPQINVKDLLGVWHNHIKDTDNEENPIVDFFKKPLEELDEVCVTVGEGAHCYPITEVAEHEGKIVLIYNQDCIIE